MKSCIAFPAAMSPEQAVQFFTDAGYELNKDFCLGTAEYGLPGKFNQKIIVAKKQIILAQDAMALGFQSFRLHVNLINFS